MTSPKGRGLVPPPLQCFAATLLVFEEFSTRDSFFSCDAVNAVSSDLMWWAEEPIDGLIKALVQLGGLTLGDGTEQMALTELGRQAALCWLLRQKPSTRERFVYTCRLNYSRHYVELLGRSVDR